MKPHNITPLVRRITLLLVATFLSTVSIVSPLYAVDYNGNPRSGPDPNNGIVFKDDHSGSVCATPTNMTVGKGVETPKWQTTIQAPYSLEDFVVELLRDIAAKEGVPEANTVTQQHVLALIAFAWGEGGNLTNSDIYNPWNTGYSASDLQPATDHHANGTQSYSSFNDGVEATARVMTGTGGSAGYQSRLGAILKDPNSTPQDFMKALTYYQNYTGNKEWAEASMPNYGGNPNAQTDYYNTRLSLITGTQTNYKDRASTLIGPPGDNYDKGLHSPHPLRYSFSNDTSSLKPGTTTINPACGGEGAVQGNIAKTAVNLAWDTSGHGPNQGDAKPIYVTTMDSVNGSTGDQPYSDCGVFVATVLVSSGAAPDYVKRGTTSQLNYARSHPDKYIVLPSFNSTSDLHVGDVLVNTQHTYIYVGKQPNGKSVAEASLHGHVPQIDSDPYPSQSGENFSVVRIK